MPYSDVGYEAGPGAKAKAIGIRLQGCMGSMMAARVLLDDGAARLHERRSQPTMHHGRFSRQVHILVDGAWRLPRRCPLHVQLRRREVQATRTRAAEPT